MSQLRAVSVAGHGGQSIENSLLPWLCGCKNFNAANQINGWSIVSSIVHMIIETTGKKLDEIVDN